MSQFDGKLPLPVVKRGDEGYNGFDLGSYRCQISWEPIEFIGGEIHVALEGELVEHVWEAVQTCWMEVVFFLLPRMIWPDLKKCVEISGKI